MKLQNLLFPDIETVTEETMFFRRNNDNTDYSLNENKIVFEKKARVTFDTYYNSFSIEKWSKYTKLNKLSLQLHVKGEFNVHIRASYYFNGKIFYKNLLTEKISSQEETSITIPIKELHEKGSIVFELEACENGSVFYGGYYETSVSEEEVNYVKIAIGICTFKREKFIEHNLRLLNREFINNEDSPLHDNLEVYVADNGNSLNYVELCSENMYIYPNKNLGGAGGFGRCMFEIYNHKHEKGFTHILLMDDDVVISPESIYRTFSFLQLIKDEYKDAFLGGAMLRLDDRFKQSEAANYWSMMGSKPIKYNYNLTNFEYVLKNEIEDSVNYLSWWYCVMPIKVVNKNNFPLPIFIKRDDIEYGIRNGNSFITLNGISVWHEPFENKRTGFLEYYYWRNQCILNAIHYPKYGAKEIKKQILKKCISYTLQYRYKDALLCLNGVEDFLKGIDYLKNQNAEQLHAEVMKKTYTTQKIEDINVFFVHGTYTSNRNPKQESKVRKLVRYLTLNGYFLPSKKTIVVPAVNVPTNRFYGAKTAIHYEEATGRAFKTNRDFRETARVMATYLKLCKQIDKDYLMVKEEYGKRYRELTSLEFWESYLFNNTVETGKKTENKSTQKQDVSRWSFKKTCLATLGYPFIKVGIRGQELLGKIIPVKKNRIAVYAYKRKGYTCNPKYLVEELLKENPRKYEIFWITQYPETCAEVKKRGIKVIKALSMKHFWVHFTSKVLISNDNLYGLYAKRPNQLYINTWHGAINYKRIGYESLNFPQKIQEKYFRLHNRQPDVYLSGSRFFTDNTAESFEFEKDVFVSTGLPRNDLMFRKDEGLREELCKKIGISPAYKIVLYAPTFRAGFAVNDFNIDYENVLLALEEKYDGKWVMLYRSHYFITKSLKIINENVIDVSQYEDMQELMYVSDVLISDYSSCLWDFSLTRKPCFVYAPDIEYYANKDRAFAYPTEKWPYAIAKDNKELINNIQVFDNIAYQKQIEEHQKDAGVYDQGNASQKVVEIIENYCNL